MLTTALASAVGLPAWNVPLCLGAEAASYLTAIYVGVCEGFIQTLITQLTTLFKGDFCRDLGRLILKMIVSPLAGGFWQISFVGQGMINMQNAGFGTVIVASANLATTVAIFNAWN